MSAFRALDKKGKTRLKFGEISALIFYGICINLWGTIDSV